MRPQVELFLVWKFTPARVVFQRLSQNSWVAVIYLVYTTTISVNFQFWKFTLFEWIFNSENSLPGSEFMGFGVNLWILEWIYGFWSEFMDFSKNSLPAVNLWFKKSLLYHEKQWSLSLQTILTSEILAWGWCNKY